ncbi:MULTISPECIES: hypothetical protein [unclassified Chelatococcus]|uniref:hypothetical protein n=1 Tax=unclassified Chelatococcus TaxID=2638111 RepID=UPI001BCE17D5|nr:MULTISPECIES: hypothetical protein [unclassified Chelatococcus]MBS7696210.1 hypothetical protein [Chelatococcus sp. YT9]MBX3557763.1 hypothetical protein [Chelatococcus sp.]
MSKLRLAVPFSTSGPLAGMLAVCTALTVTVAPSAAGKAATRCACQSAVLCGADECHPADDGYCTNSFIAFATDPPEINFCIGEDCMAGPAALLRPREEEVWLHGSFGHTAAPDQNPTSVTFLLDRTTGIGLIQASDEQGVDQVSLICDLGDKK